MPLVVLLALVLTLGRSSSSGTTDPSSPSDPAVLAPVTVPGADPPASATSACTALVAALPVRLNGLAPRVVHGPQFAVAWGNPAVVLRCGVARPSILRPDNPTQVLDVAGPGGGSVQWLPSDDTKQTTLYAVDRSVYISVLVPGSIGYAAVLPSITDAVHTALPDAVCQYAPVGPSLPKSKSCVYR